MKTSCITYVLPIVIHKNYQLYLEISNIFNHKCIPLQWQFLFISSKSTGNSYYLKFVSFYQCIKKFY